MYIYIYIYTGEERESGRVRERKRDVKQRGEREGYTWVERIKDRHSRFCPSLREDTPPPLPLLFVHGVDLT